MCKSECPQKENQYSTAPSPLKTSKQSSRIPYSSIAMETPVDVGGPPKSVPAGPARSQEQSFFTTMAAGGQFSSPKSESAAVLDTGATANLVCYRWLANHRFYFRNDRDWSKRFPLPVLRDLNSEMGELVESRTQRISKWASQVARAPSRHLCWTRRFRRCYVRGRWKPCEPSWSLRRILCLFRDMEIAYR